MTDDVTTNLQHELNAAAEIRRAYETGLREGAMRALHEAADEFAVIADTEPEERERTVLSAASRMLRARAEQVGAAVVVDVTHDLRIDEPEVGSNHGDAR